jgi:hypothetical protein
VTLEEVLLKLERPVRSGSGYRAPCPAHEDREPSLSIGEAPDGRILLHCFAGCAFPEIVAALKIAPRELAPPDIGTDRSVELAGSVAPVLQWLCETRRLPSSEAATLLATTTAQGPTVVFPYVGQDGRHLYDKYRPIREKRFWKRPAGVVAVLYGLRWLDPASRSGRRRRGRGWREGYSVRTR